MRIEISKGKHMLLRIPPKYGYMLGSRKSGFHSISAGRSYYAQFCAVGVNTVMLVELSLVLFWCMPVVHLWASILDHFVL